MWPIQSVFRLISRRLLQERTRNLDDMREMTASRASLSMLDMTRDMSEAGSTTGRMGMFKSYESLDVSILGSQHNGWGCLNHMRVWM